MPKPLILHERDDVAILTGRATAGDRPWRSGAPHDAPVQAGHKIAGADIATGRPILKFGQTIGHAPRPIPTGTHVHSHNCAFCGHERDHAVGADRAAARGAIPRLPGRPSTATGAPRVDARRHRHQLRRHPVCRRERAAEGQEILDAILRTASGTPTRSEALGLGDNEFVPWQVGAVM